MNTKGIATSEERLEIGRVYESLEQVSFGNPLMIGIYYYVVEEVDLSRLKVEREINLDELLEMYEEWLTRGREYGVGYTDSKNHALNRSDRVATTYANGSLAEAHWLAACMGDKSAAIAGDPKAVAATMRDDSIAVSKEMESVAAATGRGSCATNFGLYSAAISVGDGSYSKIAGSCGVGVSVGNSSAVESASRDSVALAFGLTNKARGVVGSWLILVERGKRYEILDIRSVKVDGEEIKENVWYELRGGEIRESLDD